MYVELEFRSKLVTIMIVAIFVPLCDCDALTSNCVEIEICYVLDHLKLGQIIYIPLKIYRTNYKKIIIFNRNTMTVYQAYVLTKKFV